MSQEQLVEGYLSGDISRRTFIRRLVASGVTLSAAIAYTHALRPAPARADHVTDHYEAPTVVTLQPTDLTNESARLTAEVDSNGLPSTVWFEFGETTAYGTRTPDQSMPGRRTPQGFTTPIVGLDPGRTYHYRAVASNQIGQTLGNDVAFSIPDPNQPATHVQAVDTDIDEVAESGRLRVLVSSDEAAQAALEASMKGKGKGNREELARRTVIARGKVTFEDAGDKVAVLKVNRAGKRALRKASRAKLTVTTTATDLAGNRSVSRRGLRLS